MPQRFSEQKRLEWREQLRLQQESGLSVSRWCKEQQVNYNSFLYWKKQLRSVSAGSIERSSFKELPDLSSSPGVTIECQTLQIHLGQNCDPAILMKCLRELKGGTC